MKQQTAVEWFREKVFFKGSYTGEELRQLFNEALAMEKEQIIDAWENGKKSMQCKAPICQRKTGNGYFNKKFNTSNNENKQENN
jgi:hypothetical protein